ncbi:VQ motif-containing protein 25 [Benincasa hispida]|uniref:VQ motif-containing protein 25 n=1 Tax=Benincasa hispida TaxID=102211 RepID=UPI0018FFAD69|nr:VQ motif-containing protein 25 [Benincasa hispida]
MDAILKKQRRHLLPNSAHPAAMALHTASHSISKPKPKIRIIHIFAPEIIKTDVANFRELVQRLTGKPATAEEKILPEEIQPETVAVASIAAAFDDRKTEMGGSGGCRRVVKKEDREEDEEEGEDEEEVLNDVVGMWNDVVGFESFIEELGEFPLLPSAHQIMHGFEETQFA